MSGLPRSGSTLLSAILNQNPNIYSSTNSPLLHIITTVSHELSNSEQYKAFPKPNSAYNVISSIPHNFYADHPQNIIIDKSRTWPYHVDEIEFFITKNPKIICPVRDILEILCSFISLLNENDKVSYIDEALIQQGLDITTINRCDYLMSKGGSVGMYLNILKAAISKGFRNNLLFVEYTDLLKHPQKSMNRIYDFLEVNRYDHNFDEIYAHESENDDEYGLKNMHIVRPRLLGVNRNISDYLDEITVKKYSHLEFWRRDRNKIFGLEV